MSLQLVQSRQLKGEAVAPRLVAVIVEEAQRLIASFTSATVAVPGGAT
jgi:hypothetical protein